jgi:hypothetical protein
MSRLRFRSADPPGKTRGWARFVQGSVVGAVIALVSLVAGAAFAGTGIGGVFNLGQSNSVNGTTTLTGATAGPHLTVNNTSTGTGASGLSISTAAGKAPLVVNSNTQVANLNASLLGGSGPSAFQRRVTGTCANGKAITGVTASGTVNCTPTLPQAAGFGGGPIALPTSHVAQVLTSGTFVLNQPGHILVNGTADIYESLGSQDYAQCYTQITGGTINEWSSATQGLVPGIPEPGGFAGYAAEGDTPFATTFLSGALAAGSYTIALVCGETGGTQPLTAEHGALTAIATQ